MDVSHIYSSTCMYMDVSMCTEMHIYRDLDIHYIFVYMEISAERERERERERKR